MPYTCVPAGCRAAHVKNQEALGFGIRLVPSVSVDFDRYLSDVDDDDRNVNPPFSLPFMPKILRAWLLLALKTKKQTNFVYPDP